MVLRSGVIIPFQYREAKKLLMIGGPEENRDLSIFDLKNVVRAAFGIYNFEFRNKKIGFSIPDELLLLYLAQRHDLTNFVVEVGQANDNFDAAPSTKEPLCIEPSSSNVKKRKVCVAPQVAPESNENSDDDQSSSQEPPQPKPRRKMRISQVFSEPPASESADDSIDIIVPKSEMHDDFVESDVEFQYPSGFMNSTSASKQPQPDPTSEENNIKVFVKLTEEVNALKKAVHNLKKTNISQTEHTIVIKTPFQTADAFQEFEGKLKDDVVLLEHLESDFGAIPYKQNQKFLRACWRSVMTDSVAQQFCWRGTGTKGSIRNLSTTMAIKIAAQQSQESMPTTMQSTNKRETSSWHALESAIQAMQGPGAQSHECMSTMSSTNQSDTSWQSDSVGFDIPTWGMIANFHKKEELQRLLEEKHKIIFENFKAHQKLTNNERVKISKTVVQHLLTDPNRTLSSKDLQNISELICQVFVGELPTTYYVKFSQGRHASGKMYDAYNNYRSSLAASGLITRRQRILKIVAQTNAQLEMEQARRTEDQIAEEKAALQLLGIADSLDGSVELWEKTFFHRQDEIVKAQMPAAEYIKKYTILGKPNGFKLYIADVERKFKTKLSLSIRDDFWQNMIERTKPVRSDCLLKIVELIQAEPREDNKHVIALMILPFLFPVSLKRGNQGITKPTKEESAQTFICHFPDMKTAESGIQKHIAKTTIDSDRLIQPLIVFVGYPLIEDSFVIVGDVRYVFKDIKDSITCATAAYLALNLKYPTCSEKVWFFVQRYICNISTAFDSCLENKVKTFAKDLNFIWK